MKNAKKSRTAVVSKKDHLEQVTMRHQAEAIVGAPGPRGHIGFGYIVTARAVPATGVGGYSLPTLAISLETRRDEPTNSLPWKGSITVPAADAWSFLRAVELAIEAATKAGIVTGQRLTAETAV